MRQGERSRSAERPNRQVSYASGVSALAKRVNRRLAASWYGPIAGGIGLALILFAPLSHPCAGAVGIIGGPSGPLCGWVTAFDASRPASVALVALAVSAVLLLQVLSTAPRYLAAVGVASTVLWIVTILVVLPNYDVDYWASVHGLEFRYGDTETETLLMLPSGLLPVIAAIRRLRRQSSEAAAVS